MSNVLLIISLLLASLLPARGSVGVIESDCPYFVVQTFKGYSVLEVVEGEHPYKGDEITGAFEHEGTVKIYDETQDFEITVRVEDFRVKRRAAIETYYRRCQEKRAPVD